MFKLKKTELGDKLMKEPTIEKTRFVLIMALILVVLAFFAWFLRLIMGGQDGYDWVAHMSGHLSWNEIKNLNFIDYDMLSDKYKAIISEEEFYLLNSETMIDFFNKVNEVPYDKDSAGVRYGFKKGQNFIIKTSRGNHRVSFDFLMSSDYFTFKPSIRYWEIEIYENTGRPLLSEFGCLRDPQKHCYFR